jgi:pimeloyl-ACP methyl ester carboxylesterase
MDNPSFQKKFIETENGKIYYWLNCDFPERPTVVFLHGLSANHTTWKNSVRAFQEKKLNCLLLDMRGHGHSDKTKKRRLYNLSVFTQDLRKIVQTENLSKIILIGYSFGGYISLDYSIKYPQDILTLVLVSTNHVNPLKYRHLGWMAKPITWVLSAVAFLLLWQKRKKYYYFDQTKSTSYSEATFIGITTMPISINLWMLSEVFKLNFSQTLSKITCPTLIIKSKIDPFVSSAEAQDMVKEIKTTKIVNLTGNTHFLGSRNQKELTEAILNFLNEKNII